MADGPSDVLESDSALLPRQPPDSGSPPPNTNRRRFYNQIWFWLLVIVTVAAAAIAIAAVTEKGARVAHHVVVYRVTSDAGTARAIDYLSINSDSTGDHEQLRGVMLPWTAVIDRKGNWPLYLMDAEGAAGATTISCSITVDGRVVVQRTSTSPTLVVVCDAPADLATN